MNDSGQYRSPTAIEKRCIEVLLRNEFKGSEVLNHQLQKAQVLVLDGNGSLGIRVPGSERAEVLRRVPVEAEFSDQDGVNVHVLLHVLEGTLDQLEIYREDSGILINAIDPSEWRVLNF